MTYRSPRPLVAFCHGLIDACITHYCRTGATTVEDRSTPDRSEAIFTIRVAA